MLDQTPRSCAGVSEGTNELARQRIESGSMKPQEKLKGIFTPNIVPLDQEDQINEPELRRYTDWE